MASLSSLRVIVAVAVVSLAAFMLPAFQAYHVTLAMPWTMRCAYMGSSDEAHLIGAAAASVLVVIAAGGLGFASRKQSAVVFLFPAMCVSFIGVGGFLWARLLFDLEARAQALETFGDSPGLAVLSFASVFPAIFATLSFIVARQFARRVPSRWGMAAAFGGALGVQVLGAAALLVARLSHCA